jgi:hypothetical protein
MNIRHNVTARALLLAGFLVASVVAQAAEVAPGKSGETAPPAQKSARNAAASTPIGVNTSQLAGMSQQNKMV